MIDDPVIFHAQCRPPRAVATAGGSGTEPFREHKRGRDAVRNWVHDRRQPLREVGV